MVALKRAGCVRCGSEKDVFSLTDVQNDVLLLSRIHVSTLSIDQQLCQ